MPVFVADTETATASDANTVTKHGPWYVTTRATGLNQPFDVVIDPATGDAYVTEVAGQRITKVTPAGVKTTFAGTGVAGFTNGSAATAQFSGPRGICRDPAGNFYVADMANHRVRKIDNAGNVTTFAGTGTAGYLDGPALSAQFNNPVGVAVDSAGNVYVVERNGQKVRKIDTAGNVTLIAGAATTGTAGTVNAVGSDARFNNPHLCRLTPDGNTLYVAEQTGNAVRNIDLTSNTVTTWVTLTGPAGVYVNPDTGWVYIGAFDAVRIYESPSQGAAISIAGGGATADNTYGSAVQLSHPIGIDRTPDGKLLVADNGDGRVRLLSLATQLSDGDTGASLTDAQTDPYITWPDTGKVTESAQVTFQTITPPTDSGKGTEAASLSFKTIVGGDTGIGTEAAWFNDPSQGPPAVQPTGRSEQGSLAATGGTPPIGPITVNPGELVIVAFAAQNTASQGAPLVSSGLGLTWTLISGPAASTTTGSAYWAINRGSSPVTGNLTCTLIGSSKYTWLATYYTGFHPSQPIRNSVAAYAGSVTLAAPANALSRPFAIFSGASATNPTPRINWQEIASANVSSLYCAVHWQPAKYETVASATNPNPNLIIAFEVQGPPFPVSDADTATFIDDQTDPGHVEADFGAFTDDATLMVKGTDIGRVTDAATTTGYTFKSSADAGTVTDAFRFDDPAQGPTIPRLTGQVESGPFNGGTFGSLTINPGELALVSIWGYSGGALPTINGVTGLGLPWTQVANAGNGTWGLTTWWAQNLTPDPISGSLTTNTGPVGTWSAVHVTGHNTRKPLAQAATSLVLAAPVNGLSRPFAVYGNSTATAPTVRTNWQQAALSTDNSLALGVHWRPDAFETTASTTGYIFAYAFEIAAAPYQVTDGDTATVTDDQTVPVPQALDTGTVTDDAYVAISRADTGKVTDAATVATSKTSTEVGVLDEAAILQMLGMADGDLASIVEDTATFVDASAADIGRIVDTATVYIVPVVVSDTDTATLTDAVVSLGPPANLVTGRDTVTLVGETAALTELVHAATGADTGRFTDTASIDGADQYPNSSDTATGSDKQTVQVAVADADTGTATDDQSDPVTVTNQYFSSSDTAAVTDKASRVGTTATDTASVTEAASIVTFASKAGADSAAVTDRAVSVRITAADSGLGSDTISDFFESARTTSDSDSGRWRDGLSLLIRNDPLNNRALDVAEQGTAIDDTALLVTVTATDSARFAEAGTAALTNLVLTDDDTGALTEEQVAAEVHESWDAGLVDEAVIVRLATSGTNEPGVVHDRASIVVLLGAPGDSGGFVDRGSLRATPSADDAGSITDDVTYLGVPVTELGETETGHITESASRVEFSRILAAADTGQFSETTDLGIANNFIDVADSGTVTDDAQTLSVAVTGAETGTVNEIQSMFDGFNLNTVDTDTATGVEPTPVVGVQGNADQLATGIETATVYAVHLLNGVWDRASAAEPTPTVTVYADDAGTAIDSADMFETMRLPTDGDRGQFRDRLDVLLSDAQSGGMTGLTLDDQGTVTENALLGDAVGSDADTVGLSDGEELFASVTDTDAGAFTDAEVLGAGPRGAEAAAFVIEDSHVVELASPTVGQDGADTATLTETPRPVIALAVDEAVTSSDADGLVGPADTDTASVTDAALTVGLAGDDNAAVTDSDIAVIALGGDDTATFDEPALVATQADDSGGVTEAETLFAAEPATETATGVDASKTSAFLAGDDTVATSDAGLLFASGSDNDMAGIVDTEQVQAGTRDGDTATPSDGQDLFAASQDADTGHHTESAVVMVDLGGQTGLITAETGLFVEDQLATASATDTDTGTGIDAQDPFADVTDAEIMSAADGQSLFADVHDDQAAHITEAAFLTTDTGMGAFTGDTGRFTETATVGRWAAYSDVSDTDTARLTETQSAHRSINLADYLDERPGSVLKVNVITRQVDMSSYFDDDEYPLNHALPEQARAKLDAFAGNLAPPARFGDLLQDTNFHYRYLSRWVTPNRRETGWFVVAWRRSPDAPMEWLA